jgi:large subunit ribosomal protein L25
MNLKANRREAVGNGPARVLRREGAIPAILYGPNTEPIKLSISQMDLEPIFKTGAVTQKLINLDVDGGGSPRKVMIKDVQRHPVSRTLLHLDLYEVTMDQKIKVMVPVTTTGKSIGVEMGGMLQIIRRELEVLCLPDQIPDTITIDITDLDVGHSFHVEDLHMEGDVEVPADVNFTILTILATKAEEEEVEGEEDEELAEEGAAAAEDAAEPDAE